MRVKVENKSSRPDAMVIALAEFAAKFFPHVTGVIPVTIKNAKAGCGSHGVCRGRRHCVIWISHDGVDKYPDAFDQMHYFRHANHESVKPLIVNDWIEHTLSIIAHEMEHTTRGNRKMRRSRQEIHAWNRSVEVVEEYRESILEVGERKAEIEDIREVVKKKIAFKKTPEGKIVHLNELRQKWERKMKLAKTKLRKLKTRIAYYEKKSAASKG